MTTQTMTIKQNVREAKAIADISMVIVLVSFSMLFATLFLSYVALRFTAPVWPPMGMNDLPLALPLLSTTLVVLSSMTWVLFERGFKTNWAYSTLVLGLGFMLSQFALWSDLKTKGILAGTGVFASIIYAFTWIHAAHIAVALILLLWPTFWARTGEISGVRAVRVESIGKFWHFLTIVWILMFISLFLF